MNEPAPEIMEEDDYQRYRREMEESVSNKDGASASDVFLTILPNICSILLAQTLIVMSGHQINRQSRLIIEFCCTVVPCIFCCTILSEKVMAISQIFLIVSAANILSILAWKPREFLKNFPITSTKKLAFLTNFRALTNIITAVCILAVDFSCFPRKFVKTETYGYSLMDTGVGLFIVANAVVSPEARFVDTLSKAFLPGLVKTLKSCAPLLLLGVGRYVSVEFLGYQRHVSEYGIHWNFFLTLACVKLFIGLLSKGLSSKYSLLTGLWILVMHEYALTTKGLKEWVLGNAPRDDLLSANREGWVSIPGYVGLYLIAIALGRLIHSTYQQPEAPHNSQFGCTRNMSLTIKLIALANVAFVATYYCEYYFQVSRRLANTGYCAWILTLSIAILTSLLIIDVIFEFIARYVKEKTRRKISKHLRRDELNIKENMNIVQTLEIFDAVNDNGLLFFLLANLLTGAINLSIKTLHVDEPRAVAIIITYMIVNITFVLLRFWGKHLLSVKKNK